MGNKGAKAPRQMGASLGCPGSTEVVVGGSGPRQSEEGQGQERRWWVGEFEGLGKTPASWGKWAIVGVPGCEVVWESGAGVGTVQQCR